jgi:hypothetical protein
MGDMATKQFAVDVLSVFQILLQGQKTTLPKTKNGTCLFYTQFAWTLGDTAEACTMRRKLSLQTYAPVMSGIVCVLVKLGG